MKIYSLIGLILCVFASQMHGADSYFSMQRGLVGTQSDVDVDIFHINHPTYCDLVLYPDPNEAPNVGVCTENIYRRSYAGLYTPDGGGLASVAYGREFGTWRIEGVIERHLFGSTEQVLPLATTGDSSIQSKNNEWSQFALPFNSYDDQGTTILGVNFFRDFDLVSKWGLTTYIGLGVGIAFPDFNYGNDFLRKTVQEGYLDVPFPVEWPTAAKLNAAGTLSSVKKAIQERVATYSLMTGVDFSFGQDLIVGVRLSWRIIEDVEEDDALWTTIRSHAPVIADGRTPFVSDFVFKSWSYLTAGLVVTRRIGSD